MSSRDSIEQHAMALFHEHGYSTTTIPMIAAASGVSRTSVFRYWGSKSEIVWAEFDAHTTRLGDLLGQASADVDTMTAVRAAIVANLQHSIEASSMWMERFAILDGTPELQAEESAHWLAWATTIARFVAVRHSLSAEDVMPQAIGAAVQAAFLATLRTWTRLERPSASLLPDLDAGLKPLCDLFQDWLDTQN